MSVRGGGLSTTAPRQSPRGRPQCQQQQGGDQPRDGAEKDPDDGVTGHVCAEKRAPDCQRVHQQATPHEASLLLCCGPRRPITRKPTGSTSTEKCEPRQESS